MSEIEWRDVVGYEGLYQVSNTGQVRALKRIVIRRNGRKLPCRGRVKAQCIINGRPWVTLSGGTIGHKPRLVHQLVAEAFHGPRPPGMDCCHNDGDKQNNHASNLRWDTRSENMRDQVRHGTHKSVTATHCPNGHEYSPDNVVYSARSNRPGGRSCATCRRAQLDRANAQRRAKTAIHGHPEKTKEQKARQIAAQRLRRARERAGRAA